MYEGTEAERPDFFISYSQEDRRWAEWIKWQLEDVGYVVVLQAWNFPAGGNFVAEMSRALEESVRILGVLSPAYLQSEYAMAELMAAFTRDPLGKARTVVPVRVADCSLAGVFRGRIYIDLVGIPDESDARQHLLMNLGITPRASNEPPSFPPRATAAAGTPVVPSKPEFPQGLPRVFKMPFLRDLNFTGRTGLLAHLHEHLRETGDGAAAHILIGMAGVGKTALAIEYIYRNKQSYDAVLWIDAGEPTLVRHHYAELAVDLGLAERGAVLPEEVLVSLVRGWLETTNRWLLIFDNAEDLNVLTELLPRTGNGQVLITTQHDQPGWKDHGHVLRCEEFTTTEAASFLLHLSGSDDRTAANSLGKELGRHPLALKQAGAYVSQNRVTLKEYRELFKTREAEMLGEGAIPTTMALALKKVGRARVAGDLLNLLAFLPPDEIPLLLLASGGDALPSKLSMAVADPLQRAKAIGVLNGYCMLTSASGEAIAVHPMVQAVVRGRLRARRKLWAGAAVKLVNGVFPVNGRDVANWPACAQLLSHAQVSTRFAESCKVEPGTTIELLHKMALYLQCRAALPAAAEVLGRALAIAQETYEGNDLRVIRILEPLGVVLREMGDIAEGRARLEEAVAFYEQVFGPRSLEVAALLVKLGFALWDFPDRVSKESSREKFERALEIYDRLVSPDDPWVAIAFTGLGQALLDLDYRDEALRCQDRALDIFRTNGDSLEMARTLDKKGYVLREIGAHEESRAAHEQAIELYTEHYDEDHPEKGMAMTNLGRVLAEAGLAQARSAHAQAVAILTATLPPGHWYIGLAERRLARVLLAAELVASDAEPEC